MIQKITLSSRHVFILIQSSISILLCLPGALCAAPDAAQVVGDLQVGGIHFTADNNVIRKLSDLSSPWTITNTDIYFPSTGKVGIGVLAPAVPLDVAGDAQISGNLLLPVTTVSTGIIKSGANTLLHTFGNYNLFVGTSAGNLTSIGTFNTANGYASLHFNTTGSDNTASGSFALYSNTTGGNNTAIGDASLRTNTIGHSNTAIGTSALYSNTTGITNTATGVAALWYNTSGSANTANGDGSLQLNTTGSRNTADGLFSLYSNSTGTDNTAVGYDAGYTTTPANANTTGSNNTFIGAYSGPGTLSQLTNATAIGANALVSQNNSLVLGAPGVKVGIGTSVPTVELDVVGAVKASLFTGDGTGLTGLATAIHNHDSSYWKLNGNTGTSAGTNFIGTTDNQALEIKVNNQRAIRIAPNTSSPNFMSGHALNLAGGIGVFGATVSGGGSASAPNVAGAVFSTVGGGWGNEASAESSSVGGGEFNNASGITSTVSGGSNNTANGNYSWAGGRQAKSQDEFSTTVHHGAFVWADSAANASVSGQDFYSMANDEFAVRARGGVRLVTAVNGSGSPTKTTKIDSSGNLTTPGNVTAANFPSPSDIRLKTDIQQLENSLDKLLHLRGVSYLMKDDTTQTRKIGVIAQELEQEYPELVMTDDTGMKSVTYANLTPVLIEAVKTLKTENEALKVRLERLEQLLQVK